LDIREGNPSDSIKPGQPPTTPADGVRAGEPPDTDDAEEPQRFLSPFNMVVMMLGVAAVLYIAIKVQPSALEVWYWIKAALGLSFIIFIHELGHFLAAKWCDVNVTTFSIGFPPAVPGCSVKWGETTYKLGMVPIGGYVQMVGQVDGDEGADDENDPRSYRKKTVGQRMLIISAGVIMNAILAAFCFIYVYLGPGKEHSAANVAYLDSEGPAYIANMRTGVEIVEIGQTKNPTFTDLVQTVINSVKGEQIPITFRRNGQPEQTIFIEPRKVGSDSKPVIGVLSPPRLIFARNRDDGDGPFFSGTPAAKAGFEYEDVIIAMTDPDDPTKITPLPDDPFFSNKGQRDYFEFARRLQQLGGQDVVLRVERGRGDKKTTKDITVKAMFRYDLGVRMHMGPIKMVRKDSPADKDSPVDKEKLVRGPDAENKLEGDQIEAVIVKDHEGKEIVFQDKTLNPERLPHDLKQWSAQLDKKGNKEDRHVKLKLRRHQAGGGAQYVIKDVTVKWDNDWRYDRIVPLSADSPMAIPELGIAYQIKTMVRDTGKDSPFKEGDVIVNYRFTIEDSKEEESTRWLNREVKEGQWASVAFRLFDHNGFRFKKLEFKVKRDGEIKEIEVPLQVDETWPLLERGWTLSADVRRVKASNPVEAVTMGISDTYNRMKEVFLNLRGMILGRIDFDNMGGPIMIAYATSRFASMDWGEFVFFLGLISINLAVVNFLPIPILDGGHMVFLIYEWIRRKPASEAVRIWATYAGLAMVLCLMIFVLSLDINRFFLHW